MLLLEEELIVAYNN